MGEQNRISAPQRIFLQELDTKFRAFVAGFGGGKTFVGSLDQALFFAANPRTVQGYFAPTYSDIRDTFWPTVDEAAYMLDFSTKVKRADKEVDWYRGRSYYGTTICRSMDDPSSIKGYKIANALVDEIDLLPTDKAKDVWRRIQARLRLVIDGVQNRAAVTTTPEGYRFVYETFKKNPTSQCSMVQASTYENARHLPDDYIATLLENYPPQLREAYIDGQFTNLTSGTVYRNYDRDRNRSAEKIRGNEPLHIGQDFNVGNMSSVVNVERPEGVNDAKEQKGWHVVDELTGLLDTPHLIETLRERYEGHAIIVYPDASGKNRNTTGATVSDISLLKAAGLKVRAKNSNPFVKDRVLAINNAYATSKLWVNDSAAPTFADAQEQQAYNKNGEPDKTTGHDHPNDAEGYFVYHQMPVRKPSFSSGQIKT